MISAIRASGTRRDTATAAAAASPRSTIDLVRTVADLTARGAEFTREPRQERWGQSISMRVPGMGELLLHQPSHPTAHDL